MNETSFPALNGAQLRRLDQVAEEQWGLAGAVLMENAGKAAALWARDLAEQHQSSAVWLFCGKGQNGGDALVAARHLANWGFETQVTLLFEPESAALSATSAQNLRLLQLAGLSLDLGLQTSFDDLRRQAGTKLQSPLIIDGILGTGMTGAPRSPYLEWIQAIRGSALPCLALDIPSGLDGDSGQAPGVAIKAQYTISFAANKLGFANKEAKAYLGELRIDDLGIPRSLLEAYATGL